MIKINLLHQVSVPEPRESGRFSFVRLLMILIFVVLLGVIGTSSYFIFAGIPQGARDVLPASVIGFIEDLTPADDAKSPSGTVINNSPTSKQSAVQPRTEQTPATKVARVNSFDAVEELVRQIPAPKPIKAKSYKKLAPTERLQFQKFMLFHSLSKFQEITPPQVGFVDMVLKVPNYYYLHGMTVDAKVLSSYVGNLQSNSTDYHGLPPKELGGSGSAREFTAYGSIRLPDFNKIEKLQLVHKTEIEGLVQKLKGLADASDCQLTGFKQPKVSEHGMYQRVIYRAQTETNYQSVLKFAQRLSAETLSVGVLQASLSSSGGENMKAVFDFVIYTSR